MSKFTLGLSWQGGKLAIAVDSALMFQRLFE